MPRISVEGSSHIKYYGTDNKSTGSAFGTHRDKQTSLCLEGPSEYNISENDSDVTVRARFGQMIPDSGVNLDVRSQGGKVSVIKTKFGNKAGQFDKIGESEKVELRKGEIFRDTDFGIEVEG